MTPEEITSMAKEAGITFRYMTVDGEVYDYRHVYCSDAKFKDEAACIERFAALVAEKAAAQERERFALECIDLVAFHGGSVELEAAIRARCQKEGV